MHKQIGYVQQEPVLFSGTIKENVLFSLEYKEQKIHDQIKRFEMNEVVATPEVQKGKMDELLTLSNSQEFVVHLTDKENSLVGERGVRLSGGQKQRISIARSMANNPKILILDEATSALDAESEHLVNKSLNQIMSEKNKTTIVIAHRLSTVKSADFVMMLHGGEIVEMGTHADL